MMLIAEIVQMARYPIAIDFPVRSRNGNQLAADVLLGGSALGCVNVGRLRADDGVERQSKRLESKNIRACSTEDKKTSAARVPNSDLSFSLTAAVYGSLP